MILPSPAFCFLSQKPAKLSFSFTPRISSEGKNFLLIPIPLTSDTFIFNTEALTLKEHHFSIYETYDASNPIFSAFHYTSNYIGKQGEVNIHAYFDFTGNYLRSTLKNNDGQTIVVDADVEQQVLRISHKMTAAIIIEIMQALSQHTTMLRNQKSACLNQLAQSSRLGVTSEIYINQLHETINDLTAMQGFLPEENTAILRILNQIAANLKTPKITPKKVSSAAVDSLSSNPQQESATASASSSSSASSTVIEPSTVQVDVLIEQKKLLIVKLHKCQKKSLANSYQERKKILNQLLELALKCDSHQ